MRNLSSTAPEEVHRLRSEAALRFGPMLLRAALLRLCDEWGCDRLDEFQRAATERIENERDGHPELDALREFAVEMLHNAVRETRSAPDVKQPLENGEGRRTAGRSENLDTLEQQLQNGLEDSFPASDPPAVVSTAIPGGVKAREGGGG